MPDPKVLSAQSAAYYAGKLAEHGPTHQGVDWSSAESQELRFAQLLKVLDAGIGQPALVDYGCGYGALVEHLDRYGRKCEYIGYDAAPEMIAVARALHRKRP